MILGMQEPQLKYGTTEIALDHTNLTTSLGLAQDVEQQSVINGERTWVVLGDYAEFTVEVNLFSYADPTAQFLTLYAYNHKDVLFKPHRDGKYIQKQGGGDCYFHISQMTLFYKGDNEALDTLQIKFVSNSYVDLAASVK